MEVLRVSSLERRAGHCVACKLVENYGAPTLLVYKTIVHQWGAEMYQVTVPEGQAGEFSVFQGQELCVFVGSKLFLRGGD